RLRVRRVHPAGSVRQIPLLHLARAQFLWPSTGDRCRMKPAVSVVMPTYNCGRYLAEAIRSVLGQTFRELELLIVDDGSTDDTGAVIARFLGDARVRWFRQPNCGPAAARNLGVR